MATSKKDTLITVSIPFRDRLKEQADKEGRTMKGLLEVMLRERIENEQR